MPGHATGTCGATSTHATAPKAVLKALENAKPGFEAYIIAAADTVMTRDNASLIAEVYPGVEVRGEIGTHNTLLSINKARRDLGYEPKYSWRDA